MQGTGKRVGKKLTTSRRSGKTLGDVTINDFANSTSGLPTRLKKASTNVACEVKQIMTKQEDDLPWNEKFDEFDDNLTLIDGADTDDLEEKQTRHHRKTKRKQSSVNEGGVDYPLDIWFLISEYISPEAVGKFASICKSSCHVVKTAKFWFHLYKRFYKPVDNLPERLQPQCMVRQYGLRTCVIRTLHYTYFSLRNQTLSSYNQVKDPHTLVKRQCCLVWYMRGKDKWYFFFKLKEISKVRSISLQQIDRRHDRQPNLIEMLENVSANPEEGCKVLRVTCLKYSMIPSVTGLILQTVSIKLSSTLDRQRLQLGFGTTCTPRAPTSQIVVLDEVVELRVLDWWHLCYPHQDMASVLLPPTIDT